jgi:hypothetical protein
MMKRAALVLLVAAAIRAASADPMPVGEVGLDPVPVVPAVKRDSGLGDLPPLSEWRDPWLYAMPAERLDSGLGDLLPLSEWREPWLYSTPAEKLDSGLGGLPPLSQWRKP